MRSRDLHCATCRAVRRFEAPPCRDGHGADCDELLCTMCGGALIVAPTALTARRPIPAPQRHAA